MLCPVCRTDMFVLEFERVEVDYCHGCAGVWLDSGELELIGERAGALGSELLAALDQQRGKYPKRHGARKCPICRRRLLLARMPGENAVEVDQCPRGDGLWFDRGELDALVRKAGAEEDNILVRFLADLDRGSAEADGSDTQERV